MPKDRSVIHRPWFWPALLVIAIGGGAIFEWVRTPGAPGPAAPRTGVSSPASARRAMTPPEAPGRAPGPMPAPRGSEPRPLIHAEIPRAHPPPGTEPEIPLTGNRVIDQERVLDDSARRWADSVRGVRPDILKQMHGGKLQEREKLQRDIATMEANLPSGPGREAIERQLETLRNNLYYLDRSIGYLEEVQRSQEVSR